MKLQCSYCKDRATLLESEPDVSDLAHAVCNDCCVSGLRCCTTEPLPDLAALRRDMETLQKVTAIVKHWHMGEAEELCDYDAGLVCNRIMIELADLLDPNEEWGQDA